MASTNLTTSAWTTVIAALTSACSAIEVFNPSGSPIQFALGAAGSEVAIPYTILPGGTTSFIPFEMTNKSRLSAEVVAGGSTISTGYLIVNLFV